MISLIVRFFAGTIGKYLLGGVAILAAWAYVKYSYEAKGRAKERAAIEKAGEKNERRSKAARRKIDLLPDSKLRDRYFRD
jgi:hypothetical protein